MTMQASLNRLFAELPSGVLFLNPEGQIVRCNPKAAAILGVAQHEIAGTPALDWLHRLAGQHASPKHMESLINRVGEAIHEVKRFQGDALLGASDSYIQRLKITVSPPEPDDEESVTTLILDVEDSEHVRENERLARLGHWVSYPDDGLMLWSHMVYELTGFDPNAAPPDLSTYEERILPADRHRLLERRLGETLLAKQLGETFESEYRLRLPDGRVRWLHERARVEQCASSGRLRLRGVLQDITGKKQVECALAEREWELAEAQRIAHVGNWVSDFVKNEIRWSAEVYRIFGMKEEQWGATHEAFMLAVHPEDRERIQQAVDDALANVAPYNVRHRIVRPDGGIRMVQQLGEVEFDGSTPLRMIGTVLDITELHQAQEKLKRSEELFRMAQQAAGFGVWEWNVATGEGYWDSTSWALLGYTEPCNRMLRYEDWLKLVHPDDAEQASRAVEQGLKEGEKFSNELRYRSAAGGWQWIQHRGQLLTRDAQGHPERMVGTHVDIDQAMRARESLRRANLELQAITDAMAHHFQEPTRRILSYAQRLDQLLGTAASSDVQHSLRFLTDQSRRLSQLVSQVHTYLAADICHDDPACVCDAQQVLKQWVADRRTALDAAEAQITYPEHRILLRMNVRHVHLLFDTLLDNALRYRHPDRPLQVHIEATLVAERYHFAVTDNGPGIPATLRDSAFGLFTRFVKRSKAPDGMGIGLATFRKTVTAHGGSCTLDAGPSGGARFMFDLPAALNKE